MVFQCEWKIPSLGRTVRHHSVSLVMPNSYPRDGIFNPMKNSYKCRRPTTAYTRVMQIHDIYWFRPNPNIGRWNQMAVSRSLAGLRLTCSQMFFHWHVGAFLYNIWVRDYTCHQLQVLLHYISHARWTCMCNLYACRKHKPKCKSQPRVIPQRWKSASVRMVWLHFSMKLHW